MGATMKEMAEAHLGNVQKAIADLEAQKAQIDEEIARLKVYLSEGVEVLKSNTNDNAEGE
jgi:uncharacterized protein YicC (UPF0701 family)